MKKYFTIFVVAIIMITAFSGCAEYYYPERHYDYPERHYDRHSQYPNGITGAITIMTGMTIVEEETDTIIKNTSVTPT